MWFDTHLELRRPQRVLLWKDEVALEEAPLVQGVRRPDDEHLPSEDVHVVDKPRGESLHRVLAQLGQLLAEQQGGLAVQVGAAR